MSVIDDVEPGLAYARGKDLGVDQGNDGVVVAMHHQGRLAQGTQPEQAAPAPPGEHLVVVTPAGLRLHVAAMFAKQAWIPPVFAAVQASAVILEELRIGIAQ